MDNLEYILAMLRALAYDYQIVHTDCRVSGTTIYLALETRQARPGAPSLRYLRDRLQLPGLRFGMRDLVQPHFVPLPPPVSTTAPLTLPFIPPALLTMPPPPPGVPPLPPGLPPPPLGVPPPPGLPLPLRLIPIAP